MLATIRAGVRQGVLGALMAGCVLLGPLHGQLRGAEDVDQSQYESEVMYCVAAEPVAGCAARRWQTVTAGRAGALVGVELYVGRQSDTSGDLVVEIRDERGEEVLATSQPVPASDIPVLPDAQAVRFTFSEAPVLTAGGMFSIVVSSVSDDGGDAWAWGGSVDDPGRDLYPGGEGWECDGGGVCIVVGLDYAFATWVDTAALATSAPQHSSALPAGLAANNGRGRPGDGLVPALAVAIIGLAAVTATGAALWLRRRQRPTVEGVPRER